MTNREIQLSKFLSFVLRHNPEAIKIEMDAEGWVSVDDLLIQAQAHGKDANRELLLSCVANNSKKRFTLSDDQQQIRAVQGHSLKIDLGLEELEPPETLFHGTATRFVDSIKAMGLLPKQRQYVHLSPDSDTAISVGQRHGQPVVLLVSARLMHRKDYKFYRAQNGVWLTDTVPPEFLCLRD